MAKDFGTFQASQDASKERAERVASALNRHAEALGAIFNSTGDDIYVDANGVHIVNQLRTPQAFPARVTATEDCTITVQPGWYDEDGEYFDDESQETFDPILLPDTVASDDHKFRHSFAEDDVVKVDWCGGQRVVDRVPVFGNTWPEPSEGETCDEDDISPEDPCGSSS